jgi:hypothetical protein
MRIGRPAEFVFARAKHFRVRLKLAVNFQANDGFVIGGSEGGGGCHKSKCSIKKVRHPELV